MYKINKFITQTDIIVSFFVCVDRIKGNCFHYDVQVVDVNFPPNRPVMRGSGMDGSREEAVREAKLSVGRK